MGLLSRAVRLDDPGLDRRGHEARWRDAGVVGSGPRRHPVRLATGSRARGTCTRWWTTSRSIWNGRSRCSATTVMPPMKGTTHDDRDVRRPRRARRSVCTRRTEGGDKPRPHHVWPRRGKPRPTSSLAPTAGRWRGGGLRRPSRCCLWLRRARAWSRTLAIFAVTADTHHLRQGLVHEDVAAHVEVVVRPAQGLAHPPSASLRAPRAASTLSLARASHQHFRGEVLLGASASSPSMM